MTSKKLTCTFRRREVTHANRYKKGRAIAIFVDSVVLYHASVNISEATKSSNGTYLENEIRSSQPRAMSERQRRFLRETLPRGGRFQTCG